jgi:hypothetical protein
MSSFLFFVLIYFGLWWKLLAVIPLGNKKLQQHRLHQLSSAHQFSISTSPESRVHMEKAKIQDRMDVSQQERARPDFLHSVIFVLKTQNVDVLLKKLEDISNPSSTMYGKHLSRREIRDLSRNRDAEDFLRGFFEYHSIEFDADSISNNEYISATASVRKWEEIFNAEFFVFHSVSDIDPLTTQPGVVRALTYSLPKQLAHRVQSVFNVVQMPMPSDFSFPKEKLKDWPSVSRRRRLTSSAGVVTPYLINTLYSIQSNTGSSAASQAMFETFNQSFSPSDLTTFQLDNDLPVQPVTHDIGGHMADNACLFSGKGGRGPLSEGKEGEPGDLCRIGNLNMQYLTAISQDTPTTYYYWNGTGECYFVCCGYSGGCCYSPLFSPTDWSFLYVIHIIFSFPRFHS